MVADLVVLEVCVSLEITYNKLIFIGPHIGLENAWPMSLLLQAMTSNDDEEIKKSLAVVLKASRLGLVHESINVNRITDYTSK